MALGKLNESENLIMKTISSQACLLSKLEGSETK